MATSMSIPYSTNTQPAKRYCFHPPVGSGISFVAVIRLFSLPARQQAYPAADVFRACGSGSRLYTKLYGAYQIRRFTWEHNGRSCDEAARPRAAQLPAAEQLSSCAPVRVPRRQRRGRGHLSWRGTAPRQPCAGGLPRCRRGGGKRRFLPRPSRIRDSGRGSEWRAA
jgi:hypothetical protein